MPSKTRSAGRRTMSKTLESAFAVARKLPLGAEAGVIIDGLDLVSKLFKEKTILSKPNRGAKGVFKNPPAPNFFPSGAAGRNRRLQTVTEDEFITDIYNSVDYANTSYPLNPGSKRTFPWLSAEAAQYEKYKFKKIEFYYKPVVSAFDPSGHKGKVIFSFNYDASDAPPSTKQQVEDTHPHSDCMPYEECVLKLDPKQLAFQDSKYVRTGGVPGGTDVKTYDGGNLYVSTVGMNADGIAVGELRVRYTVDLFIPILSGENGLPPACNCVAFYTQVDGHGPSLPFSGITYPLTFGTEDVNGIGITTSDFTSFLLPRGNYLMTVLVTFANSDQNIQAANVFVYKNGVQYTDISGFPIGKAALSMEAPLVAPPTFDNCTITVPGLYVVSNGLDTYSIAVSAYYASGETGTSECYLQFHLV